MRILGVIGSHRKNGNSDILAKEALMGPEEAGAAVELLRLINYQIEPCEGFGLCFFPFWRIQHDSSPCQTVFAFLAQRVCDNISGLTKLNRMDYKSKLR